MADMEQGGDRYTYRYTYRYTDRCTALYCGYTVHPDALSSGMAARFACCGGYAAMVEAQMKRLSLAPLHPILLLCGLLWVLTPFEASEGNVDEYNCQLQDQPNDVTRAASLGGGDSNVRLQRKNLRDRRVA